MTESKNIIQNTAAADPVDKLLTAMPGDGSGIEAQEARGQKQLLESTVLPTRGSEDPTFVELGFVFGDPVKGDPLFREATLPAGWTKKGTDHSMWTTIEDERGIERVAIFYKAAFYDRSAHMNITNVGFQVASHHIYGEEGSVLELHPDLTDSEKADALQNALEYLGQANHPVTGHIYADRAPRAQQVVDALSEK